VIHTFLGDALSATGDVWLDRADFCGSDKCAPTSGRPYTIGVARGFFRLFFQHL